MRARMDKIIPKHARIPLLICAAAQFLAYYLPRALPRLPYVVDMAIPLDRLVAVAPAWVLVYVVAYIYWVAGYVAIARVSPGVSRAFCRADLITKAAAFLCFVLLPTNLPRVEVTGGGLLGGLLRGIYAIDAPDNLFPSLHCAVSWLVARQMGMLSAFKPWHKAASFLFAALVCVSTLFTGQHVAADIAGGVAVAEGALYISWKWMKNEAQV